MRWWKRCIILLVLLGLLFLVARQLDFDKLTDTVYQIHALPLVAMIVCFVLMFLVWNLRWWFSLRFIGKVSFWRLLPVLMAGMFVNMVTPFAGLGGEPVRAWYAQRMMKKSGTKVLVLTVLEKLFGTVIIVLFIIISLLFVVLQVNDYPVLQGVAWTLLGLLAVIAVLVLLLFGRVSLRKLLLTDVLLHIIYYFKPFVKYLHKFASRQHFSRFVHRELDKSKVLLGVWLKNKRFVFVNLWLTLLYAVANFLTLYLAFLAIGVSVNPFYVIVVLTLATVVADLSFIPGGVGLLEVVHIGLFSALGISLEVAAVATILNRVVYYICCLGIGYACVVYLHIKE